MRHLLVAVGFAVLATTAHAQTLRQQLDSIEQMQQQQLMMMQQAQHERAMQEMRRSYDYTPGYGGGFGQGFTDGMSSMQGIIERRQQLRALRGY